mmetsp:Transcript_14531/g.15221  ORF Transcript_14531/g.15221 Transcript_14531/m.15221 type:complete len:149 (+) Transcript_14531:37-483(+)
MEYDSQSNISSPIMIMPTGRLRDIIEILENKQPSVINLDTCLPEGNLSILEYILDKIGPSVKTLSLRFNNLKEEGAQIITEWLSINDTIEVLYLMGTNISSNSRQNIENAFKKNLIGHRTTNMGYTLIRVTPQPITEGNNNNGETKGK